MSLFYEMGLEEPVLKATRKLEFTEPTPVQMLVVPKLLNKTNDLIVRAQTGTGKTAAFGLPLIQLADLKSKEVQCLVLCPTRELCMQISKDLESFSAFKDGFSVISVYGGARIETQIQRLKSGGQIVVGTPGRILDLIKRKVLKINNIKWLVLDEADEMLNMGFKDDLDAILNKTPASRQTLLFSATIPKEIRRIAMEYMHQPDEISVGKNNSGAENVQHEYYVTHARNRYEVLKRIADMNPDIYGIVFCRTRIETKEVAERFMRDGYNADALHGDLSQEQRNHVMNRFRSKYLQMLVATDVAARGLDVNNLTHVINYNLPDDLEIYIHRSGRTGRAGKSGKSISIIHIRETRKIKDIEKLTGKPFKRASIPGGKEICKKQLFNLIDKVEHVELSNAQINEFLPEINKKLEWLNREDLIKHFVSIEFNRFLEYYKNAEDLNVNVSERNTGRNTRKSSGTDITRFFINIGSNDGINIKELIGLINDNTQDRTMPIGKIDIMKKFSFFEVEKKYEPLILRSFKKNIRIGNVKVVVDISKPKHITGKGTDTYSLSKKRTKKH